MKSEFTLILSETSILVISDGRVLLLSPRANLSYTSIRYVQQYQYLRTKRLDFTVNLIITSILQKEETLQRFSNVLRQEKIVEMVENPSTTAFVSFTYRSYRFTTLRKDNISIRMFREIRFNQINRRQISGVTRIPAL